MGGIVGWKGSIHQFRLASDEFQYNFGQFEDRELFRITQVDGTDEVFGVVHHPDQAVNQIIAITERPGLRSVAKDRDVLALEGLAHDILAGAAKAAQAYEVSKIKTVQKVGDPADEVVRYAEAAGVDLIVMGTRGLGALEALLLGSVARKVGDAAPCSCVTVR